MCFYDKSPNLMLKEMDWEVSLFLSRIRKTLKLGSPSPNILRHVSVNIFVHYETVLKLNRHLLKDEDKLIIKVLVTTK